MNDNKQKKHAFKNTLYKILGYLFVIGILLYLSITSLYTIIGSNTMAVDVETVLKSNQDDYHFANGRAYIGFPSFISIEHTINGIIPLRTDYYYIIVDKAQTSCMVVKAPDDWDRDNFPDLYNKDGVEISGQIKNMDYQVRNALAPALKSYKLTEMKTSAYYIDLTASKDAWMKLASFLLLTSGGITLYLSVKKIINNTTAVGFSVVALIIGALLIVIYL